MSTELITSILSVVAALIPLVVTIIAILRSRVEIFNEPIDSSKMKLLSIKRFPPPPDEFKRIRRFYRFIVISLLFVVTFFYLAIFVIYFSIINISNTFSPIDTFIFLIDIILYLLIIFIITRWQITKLAIIAKPSDSDVLTFYLFEKVEIIIESEFYYLFNKSLETLRKMKFQIMELNFKDGFISALKPITLNFYYPGFKETFKLQTIDIRYRRIKIRIDKIENAESAFLIDLEFGKYMSLLLKSKITNRFIDLLINKPTNSDHKT